MLVTFPGPFVRIAVSRSLGLRMVPFQDVDASVCVRNGESSNNNNADDGDDDDGGGSGGTRILVLGLSARRWRDRRKGPN